MQVKKYTPHNYNIFGVFGAFGAVGITCVYVLNYCLYF